MPRRCGVTCGVRVTVSLSCGDGAFRGRRGGRRYGSPPLGLSRDLGAGIAPASPRTGTTTTHPPYPPPFHPDPPGDTPPEPPCPAQFPAPLKAHLGSAARGRFLRSSPRPQNPRSCADRARFSRSSSRPQENPFSSAGRAWLVAQFPAPLAVLVLARVRVGRAVPRAPKTPGHVRTVPASRAVPRAPNYSALASTSARHGGPPWPLRPWGRLRTSALKARTGSGAEPQEARAIQPCAYGRVGGEGALGSGAEPQGAGLSNGRVGGQTGPGAIRRGSAPGCRPPARRGPVFPGAAHAPPPPTPQSSATRTESAPRAGSTPCVPPAPTA